ncbi:ABC transporter permease [Thermococcus thermotolerans]|uniref:ABC transporter permease n=1 Tax=Thermococcus thermotolerans TaxID=2969672 RepID=UPI0021576932|nr:ABC transporter permease [Thermococcus thermotolerans]
MRHKLVLFLLSLFPALAVEIDVSKFTARYPDIPAEELGHLVTADLLAKWLPSFFKFLLVPLILILLLSRFGSDFERGNVLLLLSKPLTRRRYFLDWAVEGMKLALISALGVTLSGALAMLAHGFVVEDYLIGSLALSLSLIGVLGIALLLIPFATSRDAGVFLGLGAFVVLLLLGEFGYSFIPTSYLERAVSIGEDFSVCYTAVGELLALFIGLSLVGMEVFKRRELRSPGSFSVPGFSFSPRGLYGVFLGLSLQSRRFLAFVAFTALMALLNKATLDKYYSIYRLPGLLNAVIQTLNGSFLPLVVLPLGALSIGSAIENGTVRVLLSKPLRRRDFFLGTLLSDIFAVLAGVILYVAFIVAYALHLGSPLGKTLELGLVFGFLLFLSLVQYLALGYLFSAFMRGRKALFASLVLAFLLGVVAPIAFLASFGRSEELAQKALYLPAPSVQYAVLSSALFRGRHLPPAEMDKILNYEGNLAMLVVPTFVYLVVSWLRFRKADLR